MTPSSSARRRPRARRRGPLALGRPASDEQPSSRVAEVARVARLRTPRGARRLRRIRLLDPRRDLGEPRVARDERRAAGRGGLRGDHPERLGEDRRHDARVGEREQVREVAVLERAGEERLDAEPAPAASSAARSVAEADDDDARVERRASASSSTWTPFCGISLPK